jgi:imidazolonepropionase-like amidohydrolase
MRSDSIRTLSAAILAAAVATPATPRSLGAQAPSSRIAIVGATVIDPGSGRTIPDATVVVEDSLIRDVGPSSRVRVPAGARTIDARGTWVLPGYIDAHVHFFQSGGLYTRPDAIDLRALVPYERELATIRAKLDDTFARYLQGGFTSAIDVGGPFCYF